MLPHPTLPRCGAGQSPASNHFPTGRLARGGGYRRDPLLMHRGVRPLPWGDEHDGDMQREGRAVQANGTRAGCNRVEAIHGGDDLQTDQGDTSTVPQSGRVHNLSRALDNGAGDKAAGNPTWPMTLSMRADPR